MPNWSYNYVTISGSKKDVIECAKGFVGKRRDVVSLSEILKNKGVDYNADISKIENYKEIYEEALAEAYEQIRKPLGEDVPEIITFNNIVPMPEICYIDMQNVTTPDGKKGDVRNPFTGWYGWSNQNWGTKWDACNTNVGLLLNTIYDLENDKHIDDTDYAEVQFGFDTAWSPPEPVMYAAAKKYPDVTIKAQYEEESGLFYAEIEYHGEDVTTNIDTVDFVEWILHCEHDLGYIINCITWGYNMERIEDMIDDSIELEEIIEKMHKIYSYDSIVSEFKDIVVSCKTDDEECNALLNAFVVKVEEIVNELTSDTRLFLKTEVAK